VVIYDGDAFNRPAGHSVMAMITSAAHAPWPLDVAIGDLEST
jgi:mRNA interferase MazF